MFKNLFLGNTKIDFYNKRNLLQKIFIVEIVIFLTVLICAAIGILNLNFSIDFTGGTTYQLTSEYSKSDIDEVLTNNILEVSRYQTYENSDTVLFRAVEGSQSQETELLNYLANNFFVQTTAPTAGTTNLAEGDLFYDTDDNQLKIYREITSGTFQFVPIMIGNASSDSDTVDAGSF